MKVKTNKKHIAMFEASLQYATPRKVSQYNLVFNRYIKNVSNPVLEIMKGKLEDASKNNYLSGLKYYLNNTGQQDKANLIKLIKVKGNSKGIPSWFHKMDEILKLLRLSKEPEAYIYYIMCITGLRISEVLELLDGSVKSKEIKARTKGNKWKWIFLDDYAFSKVNEDFSKVWYSKVNKFGKIIKHRLDLKEAFTPHQARYLYANNLHHNFGIDEQQIQTLLQHDDLETTRRYLFDNVTMLKDLNNIQHDTKLKAIEKLEANEKAKAYKKLYIKAKQHILLLEGRHENCGD